MSVSVEKETDFEAAGRAEAVLARMDPLSRGVWFARVIVNLWFHLIFIPRA